MQNLTPATDADILAAITIENTAAHTFMFFDGRSNIVVFDAHEAADLATYYESKGVGFILTAPTR